jgi:hypothetical protein
MDYIIDIAHVCQSAKRVRPLPSVPSLAYLLAPSVFFVIFSLPAVWWRSDLSISLRRTNIKKVLIVAMVLFMVMGIGIANASAANSLKEGTVGFNVDAVNNGDSFLISGRYFVLRDLAVLAGFGFGAKGGDAKGTDLGIGVGIRKYLKLDDFAPFAGASLFYSTTKDGDQKNMSIPGEFVAEYFLHRQFSVE